MPIFKLHLLRDIVSNNLVWEVVVDDSNRSDFNISLHRDGQTCHLLLFANDKCPVIERYSIERLSIELALLPK